MELKGVNEVRYEGYDENIIEMNGSRIEFRKHNKLIGMLRNATKGEKLRQRKTSFMTGVSHDLDWKGK
jgi:hypothetical protein